MKFQFINNTKTFFPQPPNISNNMQGDLFQRFQQFEDIQPIKHVFSLDCDDSAAHAPTHRKQDMETPDINFGGSSMEQDSIIGDDSDEEQHKTLPQYISFQCKKSTKLLRELREKQVEEYWNCQQMPICKFTGQCHACSNQIKKNSYFFFQGTAYYCHYSGLYFCNQCISNDLTVIPHLILNNFDFNHYQVSKEAYEIIQKNMNKLIFQINHFDNVVYKNQILYDFLIKKRSLRLMYDSLCQDFNFDFNFTQNYSHILLPINLFSIQNFIDINNKTLFKIAKKAYDFGLEHISKCPQCQKLSARCAECLKGNIYIFDILGTQFCRKCKKIFHRSCFYEKCIVENWSIQFYKVWTKSIYQQKEIRKLIIINIYKYQMEFASPAVKKYSIENILNDATCMLKKNGNRKVILLLDKHFMNYSQNDVASLNIQISRRLLKAAQNLLIEYIQRDNISKVDLMLDRSNLYIAVLYINIQKKLKNEKVIEQCDELNTVQIEQKLGLNRLRQRIRQTICMPGNLIKATHLNRLKEKDKIKFYINECWVLLLKQLIIYAKIFKSTNEISNSLIMMSRIDQFISIKEFHKRKNIQMMKVQFQHYQNAGQLYLQLCEFKLSLQQYDLALKLLQDLIFIILKKNNTPNVIDDHDLKPVEQYIMKIIMILYIESLCYEYLSEYSSMKECLHLSQWLCSEVLRLGDEHQLHILIYSRVQDIQKYFEILLAECEIRHIIFSSFCDNNQTEMKSISAQIKEDYLQLLNEKFFLKFHHQKLHRQQFYKLNLQSSQSPQPYLLYSVPKGSKTDRETTLQYTSKQHLSFTTQDGVEQQQSRKFIHVESETKLLKQNSLSSFSRKTRHTDFSQYCKTEQSDYPKLDQELADVIVHQLKQEKPFFMLSDIQKTCQDEIYQNQKQQQGYELGKAVLMFKKQQSKHSITEPKETDSLKQLNNQIKTEFQLISGYLEAQEQLKRKKQKQKLFEQSQLPKQKKFTPFRKMLIKHSSALGLKQIKKKLLHMEEESKIMKLYQQISEKKEQEKQPQKEEQILRKMIQTNLNAIKVIMDENQKEQETAQNQLRKRRPVSVSTQANPKINPQSTSLRDAITDLAGSTQYLSTKGQSSKTVTSLVELANLKRKLNSIQLKSPNRFSQLFKKQQ